MSKLISSKVYQSYLPDGKVAVSFIADDKYVANLFVRELEHLDKIEVSAKAHKESRSLQQNDALWRIISLISDFINGEHTKESTLKIYKELLIKAQIKYEFILALPETVSILESQFRAVINTHQTREVNGKELYIYQVFIGSSKFNTKDMSELIELSINYAYTLGISSSEIESYKMIY